MYLHLYSKKVKYHESHGTASVSTVTCVNLFRCRLRKNAESYVLVTKHWMRWLLTWWNGKDRKGSDRDLYQDTTIPNFVYMCASINRNEIRLYACKNQHETKKAVYMRAKINRNEEVRLNACENQHETKKVVYMRAKINRNEWNCPYARKTRQKRKNSPICVQT
jgi:hypothetical protein